MYISNILRTNDPFESNSFVNILRNEKQFDINNNEINALVSFIYIVLLTTKESTHFFYILCTLYLHEPPKPAHPITYT